MALDVNFRGYEPLMRVFLQPAKLSKKLIMDHYRDTVLSPVEIEEHADLLNEQVRKRLSDEFPRGAAQMWGVVPGKGERNVHFYRQLKPGDWVFFTGDNHLYFGGRVRVVWRDRLLATRLWGTDEAGSTWECMYAFSDGRTFDVPMAEIRRVLGWENENRHVRNFQALSDSASELLHDLLNLDRATGELSAKEQEDAEGALKEYDGPLERTAQRAYRAEQSLLKQQLLPGTEGECALCGRILPRAFLVAAHIKKRSICTDEEKRDLRNVAMLACLLGCDGLFEQGFIGVGADGKLLVSPAAESSAAVLRHVDQILANRTVSWWNPDREKYFAWHRTHSFKEFTVR
ncbi:hypothetical protein [Kitasatospora indigofera]|uniref:hypothetical protein n=1 Tax=Kitasatospora indigofera TaxID=67307 RepID=UPI003690B1E4